MIIDSMYVFSRNVNRRMCLVYNKKDAYSKQIGDNLQKWCKVYGCPRKKHLDITWVKEEPFMLQFLKRETNLTLTENGAVTYRTTHSDCLDLFATIGAIRRASEEEIISRFKKAYTEDPDIAMKILFYARDIRGGLGERRIFRTILKWLADEHPASVRKNIEYIAEYGRFDDLMVLIDTVCEKDALLYIKNQLNMDLQALEQNTPVSLLGKWLPSINTSNQEAVLKAKKIARYLKMDDKTYRKTLVKLRHAIKIIENNLRTYDYTFDYEKQPSKAMYKYRQAFLRYDWERYEQFLNAVKTGSAKLHTDTLTPYEIIRPFFGKCISAEEKNAIDVTWNAQKDYTNGENALVVIDGSGSMYGGTSPLPASVALSLGIYFAERNTGAFHNHFITFSEKPKLVEIKGKDIFQKVSYCEKFNEVANTNLYKVFKLILNTALKHNVPQAELPSTLYIISDMEFDYCTEDAGKTNFKAAKRLFESHGYKLPRVVFWNVASRNRQQPVTMNEQGVALVSGCTPNIFSMVTDKDLNPYSCMMEILNKERYANIAA